MRFSERQGIRPLKQLIQTDSMDADLRNRLWNALDLLVWQKPLRSYSSALSVYPELHTLVRALWHDHLKLPVDTIPWDRDDAIARIRKYYFEFQWYDVYDLIDFIAGALPNRFDRDLLTKSSNEILQQELSAYRFVAGKLIPVNTKEEITAIERAARETATLFPLATEHLRTAMDRLAQKPQPDYRNSVKESVSAVESVCVAITGDQKATLGQALKAIGPQAELHGALSGAFEKLYGYTSDAEGIRHALLEEASLEQEDAVFMLVACSAFISYVIAKRSRTRALGAGR